MKWMFLVTADLSPRTHARILQVLDNQRIPIHSFVVSTDSEWVTVHALIELDRDKVNRVRALLLRVESVHRIECFADSEGICRTVALFDVSCDSSTQLPVLQAAAALGLLVVRVNHYSVVIEAVGSAQEVANYEGVFAQYGVITTVAKATLGIIRGENRSTDN
jgi:acetolactate synthase small subunit